MNGPLIYGEQVWPGERGNHSLPIYAHEILFASEEASTEFRKDEDNNGKHVVADDDPKKLEFRKCFPLFRVPFFLSTPLSFVSSAFLFQLETICHTREDTIHALLL